MYLFLNDPARYDIVDLQVINVKQFYKYSPLLNPLLKYRTQTVIQNGVFSYGKHKVILSKSFNYSSKPINHSTNSKYCFHKGTEKFDIKIVQ